MVLSSKPISGWFLYESTKYTIKSMNAQTANRMNNTLGEPQSVKPSGICAIPKSRTTRPIHWCNCMSQSSVGLWKHFGTYDELQGYLEALFAFLEAMDDGSSEDLHNNESV